MSSTSSNTRIWLLVAAHVGLVVGLFAVTFALPSLYDWTIAMLMALAFSQIVLVTFWCVFSSRRLWQRLIGLIATLGTLSPLIELKNWSLNLQLLTAACIPLVISMVVVRHRKAHLDRAPDHQVQRQEGLQYSIKHLMLLTLAMAAALTLARGIRSSAIATPFGETMLLLVIAVLATAVVAVGVSSIWAMLGTGALALRSAATLVFAIVVTLLACYALNGDLRTYGLATIGFVGQAILLLTSLYVVRLSGYRLVRNSGSPSTESTETADSSESEPSIN